MDDKKLWLKISGSINYYLQYYSKRMTNEELLKDYLEYALPDMDGDGVHTYLDKQTLERIVVDEKMMDKAKTAFMGRLEKRRAKELPVKEEKKVLAQVIDFSKYKKLKGWYYSRNRGNSMRSSFWYKSYVIVQSLIFTRISSPIWK